MCALPAEAVREGLPETVTLSKDGGESVSPWTPQGRALGAKGARAPRQEVPVSFRKRWEAAAAGWSRGSKAMWGWGGAGCCHLSGFNHIHFFF